MKATRRGFALVFGAGFAALALSGSVYAQSVKPLKMILSVPPGAALDASARLLAEKLRVSLDRQVLIDYKVGGVGLSAGEFLKTTEPDGSFLLFTPTSFFAYHPFLYSKLTYDPDKDLLPVCEGLTIPTAVTVSSASGLASFKDWVEAVKRDPKMRFVGTPGPSGVGVFLALQMGKTFGVDLQVVPYKGGRALQTDLLGGQVPASASVIAPMRAQGGGAVVNVASMAAKRVSYAGAANYTASKAGVLWFTWHAAFELGAYKIRVNAVCPGPTLTGMSAKRNAEQRAETAARIPLGRWVMPEDVANAILFLASDEAAMCTGTSLDVDGGILVSNGSSYEEYFSVRT